MRHQRMVHEIIQQVKTARVRRAEALIRETLEKLSAPRRGHDGPEMPDTPNIPKPPSIEPVKPPSPPKSFKPKSTKFNPLAESGATSGTI